MWNLWLRVDSNLSLSYIPVNHYSRTFSYLFLFVTFSELLYLLLPCFGIFPSEKSLQGVGVCYTVSLESCQEAAAHLQAFLPPGVCWVHQSVGQSSVWIESGACFWRLDSSYRYLGMLDLGRKHYIWVHLYPGMPELGCLLQSITRKREGSLAHQREVIPIIDTQR